VALLLGLVVIGLSALIAGFIAMISHGVGPSDQVVRGACFGSLLGSAGVVAVLGARQERPALVAAAGLISIGTSILSVVTLGFAVLGLALVVAAATLRPAADGNPGSRRSEIVRVTLILALVAAAAVALLGTTETRCWVGFGTPVAPRYEDVPCSEGPVSVGGPDGSFASGENGGTLTPLGVTIELGLIAAAVLVAAVPAGGRGRASLSSARVDPEDAHRPND
jgi:hypothetical protein